MTKLSNLSYLIKEGSKSDKFKKLPRDATKLTVSEFYYLSNYILKATKKINNER